MYTTIDIFRRFLILGCMSFGGPAAHLGYFQKTFVEKLKWIDSNTYAGTIALTQFLPGPGSSQAGFAIGLKRGGLAGGVAAFAGFTLPSFFLMYLLASAESVMHTSEIFSGAVQGLKLLAVVVVADASFNMFRSFSKTKFHIFITAASAVVLLIISGVFIQMAVLASAAVAGLFYREKDDKVPKKKIKIDFSYLIIFIILFAGLPFLASKSEWIKMFSSFYQSGSLVFGGGHVVLPLLQETVGESLGSERFLLGYAAAQAVPGPMFTFASFLGAELYQTSMLAGAAVATAGIFLPGFLLVLSFHKTWEKISSIPAAAGAISSINAAVVGLLISALYTPVFVSAVSDRYEMASVIAGIFFLRALKIPVFVLVAGFAVTGILLNL